MAITEIRCDNPPSEMSSSIQQEDAFIVALHLRDRNRKYWENGRQAPVHDLRAGQIRICDLKAKNASGIALIAERLSTTACRRKRTGEAAEGHLSRSREMLPGREPWRCMREAFFGRGGFW
jgi:hypothetical protein